MLGLPRSARLILVVLGVVILPSIYLLYPHHDVAQSPDIPAKEYEAGGIDSAHWRDPIKPDFEKEEARWTQEEDVLQPPQVPPPYVASDKTWLNHGMVELPNSGASPAEIDEKVLSGGVIMPKLENATAK